MVEIVFVRTVPVSASSFEKGELERLIRGLMPVSGVFRSCEFHEVCFDEAVDLAVHHTAHV